jgi:hypothetical protein
MTRGGTDMPTDTTPRPSRQAPGRGAPRGRAMPPGRGLPPDRIMPARGPDQMLPGRGTRPGPKDRATPRPRPFSAPRHTRPFTGPGTTPAKPARPATRPAPRPAIGRMRPRRPRAPFILLLVGLLGGALISLLVISTTLAQGSYRITNLQEQNANLAKQEQLLTQQVAQASSPAQIAQEAEALGMRPDQDLQFINLKTGKIVSGHPSQAESEISVPGYTP